MSAAVDACLARPAIERKMDAWAGRREETVMVAKTDRAGGVKWLDALEPAFERARDTGKLVLLDAFKPG